MIRIKKLDMICPIMTESISEMVNIDRRISAQEAGLETPALKNEIIFLAEGNHKNIVLQASVGRALMFVKDATYAYSNDLAKCSNHTKKEAYKNAGEITGNRNTPAFIQAYLRIILGKPNIELVHIGTSTGWDQSEPKFLYFGYK